MPMDAWKIRCQTCGWMNWGVNKAAVKHSGTVHTEMLCPGHVVMELEYLPKGWVR